MEFQAAEIEARLMEQMLAGIEAEFDLNPLRAFDDGDDDIGSSGSEGAGIGDGTDSDVLPAAVEVNAGVLAKLASAFGDSADDYAIGGWKDEGEGEGRGGDGTDEGKGEGCGDGTDRDVLPAATEVDAAMLAKLATTFGDSADDYDIGGA